MIITILVLLIQVFVWNPIGMRISNHYWGGYGITGVDLGTYFPVFWMLIGVGLGAVIITKYEVWIE